MWANMWANVILQCGATKPGVAHKYHGDRDGPTHRTKAMSQSIRAICVGNDPKSDGLQFYSPDFSSLIGSVNHTLDHVPPSGPICGIPYDGGAQFDLHCDDDNAHRSQRTTLMTQSNVLAPTSLALSKTFLSMKMISQKVLTLILLELQI